MSGNLAWLKSYMPALRKASEFLFDLIDPNYNLLRAPGSLFIDVFIRENFTTDSNAMCVMFFRAFAEAEEAVGNSTGAGVLRTLAENIGESVNKYLWAQDQSHFVTQLNLDGSTRDFVDYDSNLLALAAGIVEEEGATKIFSRIDGGRCTHGRATFVSEVYYGKEDTTHGNVGDSWCSMGRIGWFDALARKKYSDLETFHNVLYEPIRDDLNRWTWLRERYGCDGLLQQNRTEYYFEYPSVVAMMAKEIKYGVILGLNTIRIEPFGPTEFRYHVGNVLVDYSRERVLMRIPGSGSRHLVIKGLVASKAYKVTATGCKAAESTSLHVDSGSDGTLEFDSFIGDDEGGSCTVKAHLGLE